VLKCELRPRLPLTLSAPAGRLLTAPVHGAVVAAERGADLEGMSRKIFHRSLTC
jgi:hypothetical protein